ncbi:helix-turn-helix transcriptional regulator [Nocardia sp. NPDC006630]|uniref:helix-turn-helix transcriptional regulator n=1 Tax=Nocardia sp. NPDC006630 TaxID=3157181 RepID=UPI0033B8F90A
MMNRPELADFLRTRRQALQPEDVGLERGPRRRTSGLRREEVAQLCSMSADYYARLERGTGPRPSEQMTAALARGLRLSLAERDHLFQLIGHHAPQRAIRDDHISPALMRVLDRFDDVPAQIMSGLGETLRQTRVARALLGDETRFAGPSRSVFYRWFTDPSSRNIYPEEDQPGVARIYTAQLRRVVTEQGPESPAAELARSLAQLSTEFTALWSDHEIGLGFTEQKRILHPEVGLIEVHCQTLLDPDQHQALLLFIATPGSSSQEKLDLLSVIGNQNLTIGL